MMMIMTRNMRAGRDTELRRAKTRRGHRASPAPPLPATHIVGRSVGHLQEAVTLAFLAVLLAGQESDTHDVISHRLEVLPHLLLGGAGEGTTLLFILAIVMLCCIILIQCCQTSKTVRKDKVKGKKCTVNNGIVTLAFITL